MSNEKKLVFVATPISVLLIVGGVFFSDWTGIVGGIIGIACSALAWREFE